MRVKILSKTGSFGGVRYNTNKMDRQTGKLMSIRNFGILQEAAHNLKPEEVKNYLKSWSASNTRVKDPQLHVMISCKGRENTKEELTKVAENWLEKMGYGQNPFIIVAHSDTNNNHVHIVSSRIDKNGKKINDSFEGDRGNRILQNILKQNPHQHISEDVKKLEAYSFSSLAQFKLLYEKSGYSVREQDGNINLFKTGELVKTYSQNEITSLLASKKTNQKRISQLQAIFKKYSSKVDNTLRQEHQNLAGGRKGKIIGYKSDLTEQLKEKFGIDIVFHFKDGLPPYGYTVIDRAKMSVFKGSEIMKLKQFTGNRPVLKYSEADERALIANKYNVDNPKQSKLLARYYKIPEYKINCNRQLSSLEKIHYQEMLNYFLDRNSFDNLSRLNIKAYRESGEWFLLDIGSMNIITASEILNQNHYDTLNNSFTDDQEVDNDIERSFSGFNTNVFANDVDDSKAKKKRKKKVKR
tara:strand:+ start:8488 stop:9891 length:1404 start_codon:yes stop_codon:yes gene_type:complete